MKRILNILLSAILFCSCHNSYLDEYYIAPEASFSVSAEDLHVRTLESVLFTNKGKGQTYSIFTGDTGHKYSQTGNTGFAVGSNGCFSYSYREPGKYTVVWIASSVDSKGSVISDIDSLVLDVADMSGGLDNLSIYKIYRMDDYDETHNTYYHSLARSIDDSILLCPIIYEAWRPAKINTIKSAKLQLKYQLTSPSAALYWYKHETDEWLSIRSETDNIFSVMDGERIALQRIKVVTGSGYETYYNIAAVMIPKLTSYKINGVEGEISHVKTSYDEYEIRLTLPEGADVSNLCPEFTVMENDANLYDGTNATVSIDGIAQQSGVSNVDFSNGEVIYDLHYQMLGYADARLSIDSKVRVIVDLQ